MAQQIDQIWSLRLENAHRSDIQRRGFGHGGTEDRWWTNWMTHIWNSFELECYSKVYLILITDCCRGQLNQKSLSGSPEIDWKVNIVIKGWEIGIRTDLKTNGRTSISLKRRRNSRNLNVFLCILDEMYTNANETTHKAPTESIKLCSLFRYK